MSKEKVRLLDLPSDIITLSLSFLSVPELHYPMMEINRKLNELVNSPPVIARVFFNQLKVPPNYGAAEFGALSPEERRAICKDIFWASGANEKLTLTAYYTDGGVDQDSNKFFISNIYSDNPSNLYCSVRGENVHVKAVCSDSVSQYVDLSDLAKYKVPESKTKLYEHPGHTYMYPIKSLLSQHDPQNSRQFSVIKYHDLNRNLSGYTCFLQSFAVFVSMEEIDPYHPLIQLFNGVKKLEQVESLGFEYISLQSTEDTKVIEFSLHSLRKVETTLQRHVPGARLNGVYPLMWGDISKNTTNYLNMIQKIGFRFLLLKLIDSYKSQADGNIDCYNMSLSGSCVRLRFSSEE